MVKQREAAEASIAFLGELTERLELGVELAVGPESDGAVVIQVTGDGTDRLKSRPDLISALTRLTGQAAGRVIDDRVKLILDVGGDFDARKALLEEAADDLARAVARSGRRAVLQGLASTERRVVHSRLVDDASVNTRSEGEENARRLLIERA